MEVEDNADKACLKFGSGDEELQKNTKSKEWMGENKTKDDERQQQVNEESSTDAEE